VYLAARALRRAASALWKPSAATRLKDGIIGRVRFDANGDLIAPLVTIMRIVRRDGVSDVQSDGGAAINRIITPPPTAIP
jgi:hypothetical protein